MLYRVLADVVVIAHLGFVLFAVLGGFLVLLWRWVAWTHPPAVVWAALIEFTGWGCPLTPLENWLRTQGGVSAYQTGFLDHYVLPVLYPPGLTRDLQLVLGTLVLMINLGIYAWLLWRDPTDRFKLLTSKKKE